MEAQSSAENRKPIGNPNLAKLGEPYRFKPGNCANPGGRPKSRLISAELRNKIAEIDPNDSQGRTNAEVVAEKIVEMAKNGDIKAIAEVIDRIEGKATQSMNVLSVQIHASWDKLSESEMIAYAERGELPEWFEMPAPDGDEERCAP